MYKNSNKNKNSLYIQFYTENTYDSQVPLPGFAVDMLILSMLSCPGDKSDVDKFINSIIDVTLTRYINDMTSYEELSEKNKQSVRTVLENNIVLKNELMKYKAVAKQLNTVFNILPDNLIKISNVKQVRSNNAINNNL